MQISTRPFDFVKLVRSHGWAFLAPFGWDENSMVLSRPLRLGSKKHTLIKIWGNKKSLSKTVKACPLNGTKIGVRLERVLTDQIRRMLCLDIDFSEFHTMCEDDPVLGFVTKSRCGGLLRSPSAFEDLVKTVCTTNCDWRNTKKICQLLCSLEGGNFPSPDTILKNSPMELRKKVPLGYRSETVCTIARLTAEGKLPLDTWAEEKDYDKIKRVLLDIKGVGSYSINHMMVLLGNFVDIPVDSEVLRYLREIHFGGEEVSPREAVKPYDRYGKFRFLAYKFSRMSRKMNYIDK
jgi:3-methyladenine DNA glycosylase/8-oxoguanine DNA glycosylase